jgi:TRAP transporter TAXI family solute receptor
VLANWRARLFLVAVLWVATVLALVMWLSGQQDEQLSIAAGPAESETFKYLSVIAEVLNERDNDLHLTVFETGGTRENMALIESGLIDVATVQADARVPAEALGVARLYQDAYHLIVNAAADIQQISDLRGKRVAIPPEASSQNASFWFLVDHYQLNPESMVALPMSADAANFAMLNDQVDAVFRVRAPGNRRIRELIGDKTMKMVPIEQARALALKQPALTPNYIPRGSYRGSPPLPAEDLPTVVLDLLLVASENVPEPVAYRLTQELFDARPEIVARYPLAGFLAALDEEASGAIPAHPGARRYFDREKPGAFQQHARLLSLFLYAAVLLTSAGLALRSRWIRARRVRVGDFNKRLMQLAEDVRDTTDYHTLRGYKNRLMDILSEVVSDLDHDKVSQEEFEHFSFTWQAVDALVRDQLMMDRLAGANAPRPEEATV